MKITRKEYDDAGSKEEKLIEKLAEVQAIRKAWQTAEKSYGKPREGDEIVAFNIEDGVVEAITRRNSKAP